MQPMMRYDSHSVRGARVKADAGRAYRSAQGQRSVYEGEVAERLGD